MPGFAYAVQAAAGVNKAGQDHFHLNPKQAKPGDLFHHLEPKDPPRADWRQSEGQLSCNSQLRQFSQFPARAAQRILLRESALAAAVTAQVLTTTRSAAAGSATNSCPSALKRAANLSISLWFSRQPMESKNTFIYDAFMIEISNHIIPFHHKPGFQQLSITFYCNLDINFYE